MVSLVASGGSLADLAEAARLCEEAGFESVWSTEFYDRSATIGLAAMAQATSTIGLGTAIAHAFGRRPLITAVEIRDLDELSGGRVTIGLGTGTRRMQEDWLGIEAEHPASRMEELVPLLRCLCRLDQGPVEHEGRFYRVQVRPTAAVRPPLREQIPIYMAGVNPRMVESAGRVADGLVGHPLFTPEYVREIVRPALARGAERTGRDPKPPIAGYLTCCVDEDRDQARQSARAMVAFNSTVRTYEVIHRHHGFTEQAALIREAWRSGDFAAAMTHVTDEMLDTIALCGTPAEVRERFAARWEGVYEQTLLWPPAFLGLDGMRAVVDAFREPGANANVATVREIYEHWARGDYSGAPQPYAPDIRWLTFSPEGDDIALTGGDEVRSWFRDFLRLWRQFRVEAREITAHGDRVLLLGHQWGEGQLSGATIDMPVFAVWTFRDGLVTEVLMTRHRERALEAIRSQP